MAYDERDSFLNSELIKNLGNIAVLLILYHATLRPLSRGVELRHIYINHFGAPGAYLMLYLLISLIIAVKVSKYIISPSRSFKFYSYSLI